MELRKAEKSIFLNILNKMLIDAVEISLVSMNAGLDSFRYELNE